MAIPRRVRSWGQLWDLPLVASMVATTVEKLAASLAGQLAAWKGTLSAVKMAAK